MHSVLWYNAAPAPPPPHTHTSSPMPSSYYQLGAGKKIYLFRYVSFLPVPFLLWQVVHPCKSPNPKWISVESAFWGWDVLRVDREVLKPRVQSPWFSCMFTHMCTYMYMPPPLQPSFLFHFSCCAHPHPYFFSLWWLALEDEESNATFSLLFCKWHSELVREWCAKSILPLKMGNYTCPWPQRGGQGKQQGRYQVSITRKIV